MTDLIKLIDQKIYSTVSVEHAGRALDEYVRQWADDGTIDIFMLLGPNVGKWFFLFGENRLQVWYRYPWWVIPDSVALEAVTRDGSYVMNVNQTRKVCLAAVRQNGLNLRFIRVQTEEICLEAINENPEALMYVSYQTEKLIKNAVSRRGSTIRFVDSFFFLQDPEGPLLYLTAVKQDGLALEFVPSKYKTPKLCLEAVRQNGLALAFVAQQTPLICKEAVRNDPFAVKMIENIEGLDGDDTSSIDEGDD